jgi:hypothetical protein
MFLSVLQRPYSGRDPSSIVETPPTSLPADC